VLLDYVSFFAFLLKEAKYSSAEKTSLVSRQINVEITKSGIKKYSLSWTNDQSCRLIFFDEKKWQEEWSAIIFDICKRVNSGGGNRCISEI
jgi:hypothetical protein